MTRLLTILALIFSLSLGAIAQDTQLTDPAKEAAARSLMKELRCLQCQNQSIDDSNADMAKDLRMLVREQIAGGKSEDEVKDFLVARYGDWVLLKPPVKQSTWFLWGSPVLLLLFASAFLLFRRKNTTAPEALSTEEEAALKTLLSDKGDV